MVIGYKINEVYDSGLNLFIYGKEHCTKEDAMLFLLSDNLQLNRDFTMNGKINQYNKIGIDLREEGLINLIWIADSKIGLETLSKNGIHFINKYDDNPIIKEGLLEYSISSDEHLYIINGAYGESGGIYEDLITLFSNKNLRGYHLTDKPFYKNCDGFIYDFGLTARMFFSSSVLHKLPKQIFKYKDASKRFVTSLRKISNKDRQNFYSELMNHNLLNNSKFLFTIANLYEENQKLIDEKVLSIDETNGGLSFSNNLVKEACWIKKLRDVEFLGKIDCVFESNNISDDETRIPNGNYLTEKTFNCIFNELPFLYISNHCHSILKNVGINDYSDVWGVDYEKDDYYKHVLDRMEEMCNLSDTEFEILISKAEVIATENYNRFLELVYEDPIPKFIKLYNDKSTPKQIYNLI